MEGMLRDMTCALVVRRGRLLMVHNAKHGLRVEPPGGKKYEDEGWEESVVRELGEELGVEARVTGLFGEYETSTPEGDFLVRMYLCEITGGEPKVCEPEKIPAFGWYSVEDMERLRAEGFLVPNMVAAMEDIRALLEEGRV